MYCKARARSDVEVECSRGPRYPSNEIRDLNGDPKNRKRMAVDDLEGFTQCLNLDSVTWEI